MCNKVVNNVNVLDKSNIWHSRLCYINFGCLTRLANLNLIPKFNLVKDSKCQVCVQSKQPRKPHKAAKARNLAPLELVHSDLCEMNGELIKSGKRYFMTFIDDCTRFCYVYLLKTKDVALHYFKVYKAKIENQLEKKSNVCGLIAGENISQMNSLSFAWCMKLFIRGHHHTHHSPMGLQRERTTL
jgi:hypothetical protein